LGGSGAHLPSDRPAVLVVDGHEHVHRCALPPRRAQVLLFLRVPPRADRARSQPTMNPGGSSMTQYPITESRLSGRQLVGLVVAAAAAVVVAFVVAHAGTGVAMMKAAGLTGGTAISGVANFVSQIKDHIIWLAATATALMAAVIGF